MLWTSGLGHGARRGLLTGAYSIDPNAGFTSQALGHRVALDWIHGHVPWWNPFEGLGAPLAGEMQAAAFFPPILFLLVSNGQVFMYLLLNLIAAYCTFFLLRKLSLHPWACATAAVMFGLNGTFAWFRFAPSNPVCFLPMALLGVEMIRERVLAGAPSRWWLLAAAMGLSLVAGFPEVAYLDGLVVGIWVLFRLPGLGTRTATRYLCASAGGAVAGVMLAAPVLIAFADYLPHADAGGHSGAVAHYFLANGGLSGLVFPYVYGPIFGSAAAPPGWWSNVGGYITLAALFLAVVGLWSRPRRSLKIALICWAALLVGRTYGLVPAADLFDLIPGMKSVAAFRYMFPGLEMVIAILAAQGIGDLIEGRMSRVKVCVSAGVVGVIGFVAALRAHDLLVSRIAQHPLGKWERVSLLWALLALALLVFVSILPIQRRLVIVTLVGVLSVEAVIMFALPEMSAPRSGGVDTQVVSFLQKNLGTYRFATLGPLAPNYGSYFGTAAINVNDTPIPKALSHVVTDYLDPNAVPLVFNGSRRALRSGPSAYDALIKYASNYEALGVKYIVTRAGSPTAIPIGGHSLPVVYRDGLTEVYEMPDPTSLFSDEDRNCAVRQFGVDVATVRCDGPSVLQRAELWMPGWSVSINGRSARLRQSQMSLQLVDVPAGTATIRYSFAPPHANLGFLAALLAVVAALLAIVAEVQRTRRARRGQLLGSASTVEQVQ
jgi:hypothetical protein